ncbi:hypothetical protein CHS0354_015389 [Potamilus streckersoni]|uniref:Uncharacterized protein n=1 Tax=Potamilus streckersoni TaxID=2493646 RepID=A0AAE0S0Q6_9BIVA|nr:hypothetical protein CHS0354_015389 [Potamilus streckersoni]
MGNFVAVLVMLGLMCVANVLCTLPRIGGGGSFSQIGNLGGLSSGSGQGFYGNGIGSFGLPYGGGLYGNYQGSGYGNYLGGGFGNSFGGGLGGYSNFLGGGYGNFLGSSYGNFLGSGLGNFQGGGLGNFQGSGYGSYNPLFKGLIY